VPIEFPIVDLLSKQSSYEWLLGHFHPQGLVCPRCGAGLEQARLFRIRTVTEVEDYRCGHCDKTYNVFSGTVFEGRRLKPEQAVLLVRGTVKGEQAQILANEVGCAAKRCKTFVLKYKPMRRYFSPIHRS